MTNVYFFVMWAQVRVSVTRPPAVMEAPATTMEMPSAVRAHLAGEETHATQVRHWMVYVNIKLGTDGLCLTTVVPWVPF